MKNIIELAKEKALRDERLTKEEIVELLSIDVESEDFALLGKAAYEVAEKVTGKKAYLWGALGVDYKPCEMDCDFCSLGKSWGLVKETKEFSQDEMLEEIRSYVEDGVRWIVLRTTEFYSLEVLAEFINRVRREIPGKYEIGLNVGEFGDEKAKKLHEMGVNFIYHSLRLREGIATRFNPQDRLNTLSAIKNSELDLVFLVEPIGIEHTNEEIADICMLAVNHNAIVTGGMARIPVEGTPLGKYPQISDKRLAQIVAVTRLAGGFHVPDICVHPATKLAIEFGANVMVVETGSVPRDSCACFKDKWHEFDAIVAREWFGEYGYTLCSCKE